MKQFSVPLAKRNKKYSPNFNREQQLSPQTQHPIRNRLTVTNINYIFHRITANDYYKLF